MGRKKEQCKYNNVIDRKLICWICGKIALRDNSNLCVYESGG